ncbi:MAG: helix-turn-helix transcriptional regulator [Hungatella sp.]|nr:helix-turn-helix transcriptional regulator [Hungatella sp.]MTK06558.1 helix-turn-helix transcriptional regulator [Hungatella sp.]
MKSESKVGEKIASIRDSKNITQEELAERCNMSLFQLKAIEEQNLIASLAILIKIARVLGVRLGTFLDDDLGLWPVVIRNEESHRTISFSSQVSNTHSHLNFFSLAGNKSGRHMEPFLIDILPADNKEIVLSSHEGEEFLYVLEGTVKIHYGKEEYILNKGESIYYDSIVAHLVCSAVEKPAKILAVVYSPM